MAELKIEYPARGETYCLNAYGVYSYRVHPDSSARAGQTLRRFVDVFPTRAAAEAAYPGVAFSACGYTEAVDRHGPPE